MGIQIQFRGSQKRGDNKGGSLFSLIGKILKHWKPLLMITIIIMIFWFPETLGDLVGKIFEIFSQQQSRAITP